MAKHTIHGFITMRMPMYEGDPQAGKVDYYTYDPRKYSGNENLVIVREEDIVLDVPDDFDPRPVMVDALREQKVAVMAEATKRATQIEQRIQSLLAIEYVQEA